MKNERVRTYTYRVTCPLPPTKLGEPRMFVSYVYNVPTIEAAKDEWFNTRLAGAKKNGIRGKNENLRKNLKLTVERVTRSNDERIASMLAK